MFLNKEELKSLANLSVFIKSVLERARKNNRKNFKIELSSEYYKPLDSIIESGVFENYDVEIISPNMKYDIPHKFLVKLRCKTYA
jgi:hypothetical protein